MRPAREAGFEGQRDRDPDHLVFIDETAANTAVARRYGRPTARTLPDKPGSGPLENPNRHGSLAHPRHHRALAARWVDERAGYTCLADVLVPILLPGEALVMDNLPAHKVRGIHERIEVLRARPLHLPAYSPGFNPIKLAFAKLQALLRSAAARSFPDLCNAVGAT